jgi:hypothetical protein
VSIGADIAVILAFIITGVAFWKTFTRTRKDEQTRTVMEISNRLNQSENYLHQVIKDIKEKPYEPSYDGKLVPTQEDNFNYLYNAVIRHFNNWEWFAVLVNKNEIKEDYLKEHFKNSFITDYEDILSKYLGIQDDKFPEVLKLYNEWKK